MKYIIYRRFKEKAICGNVNIASLTECVEQGGVIYCDDKPLCLAGSENAHTYLAINEDGNGMTRGDLTRKITNRLRIKDEFYQARWDRIWGDPLCQKYKRPEHPEHWLWNNAFYDASIDDLEYIWNLVRQE